MATMLCPVCHTTNMIAHTTPLICRCNAGHWICYTCGITAPNCCICNDEVYIYIRSRPEESLTAFFRGNSINLNTRRAMPRSPFQISQPPPPPSPSGPTDVDTNNSGAAGDGPQVIPAPPPQQEEFFQPMQPIAAPQSRAFLRAVPRSTITDLINEYRARNGQTNGTDRRLPPLGIILSQHGVGTNRNNGAVRRNLQGFH